jgi:hypothetical protein
MAGKWPDDQIAASLNRMGLRTGQDQSWTAGRVRSFRAKRGIHAYRSAERDGQWLTMSEAARELGVTNHVIRRLIREGIPYCAKRQPSRYASNSGILNAGMVVALGPSATLTDVRLGP